MESGSNSKSSVAEATSHPEKAWIGLIRQCKISPICVQISDILLGCHSPTKQQRWRAQHRAAAAQQVTSAEQLLAIVQMDTMDQLKRRLKDSNITPGSSNHVPQLKASLLQDLLDSAVADAREDFEKSATACSSYQLQPTSCCRRLISFPAD